MQKNTILLFLSHCLFAVAGFAAGIYLLPIITAPEPPTQTEMVAAETQAEYSAMFRRDLAGSDFFHWGEGDISIGKKYISFNGSIAPGPDYKLYLSPSMVETESEFKQLKSKMVKVGDVKTFDNFIISVPSHINPATFSAVVIWCESFEEFITAASYK